MALEKAVGNVVREIRKQKGITLVEMGDAIKITNGHLSQIERGERLLSIDTLKLICTELGVSPATVVRRADNREYSNEQL